MAVRPGPGRIYDFLKVLFSKQALTEQEMKKIIDRCFPGKKGRQLYVCRTTKKSSNTIRPCTYSAFIIGESTHNREGEQDVAIKLIDYLAGKFKPELFVLKEEGTSGSSKAGIFSTSKNYIAYKSKLGKHKIAVDTLAGGEQFFPENWVPVVLRSRHKLITYIGSAHTSVELYEYFKKALPNYYNMDPGTTVLKIVQNLKKKGLVVSINIADEFIDDYEIQAYREKLQEFPDAATFELWLIVFKHDMNQLLNPLRSTYYYRIAENVYFAYIGPYTGLKHSDVINIVWKDKKVQERIRKTKHWTLYDIFSNGLRFQDNNNKGKHFIKVNIDSNKKAVTGKLEEKWY